MNYHIDTALILQEFKPGCECPLCNIKNIVEGQLTDQFLSEAVMVDDFRKAVNEKGFCPRHTEQMFKKSGKLGLALQHVTRIKTLAKKIEVTSNLKAAKKQGEFFSKASDTCIICDITTGNMTRYYKTVAQMFNNEQGFKERLKSTYGFCFEHYSQLLKYAAQAKAATSDYVLTLTTLQDEHIKRLTGELQWFCDKHDYRNAKEPWKNSADALLRSITKLHGGKM